ncbi:hypothetical protein ACLK19_04710 [Escherichia coli]
MLILMRRQIRVFWLRNPYINSRLVFLQTKKIHKKDSHMKGQQRYVPHKRMNNAFMMHASPARSIRCLPHWISTPKCSEGVSGRNMWMDCVVNGINARKLILDNCRRLRPFVPELVDGKPWQSYETAQIAVNLRFFQFVPRGTLRIVLKAMRE